MKNLLKRKSEPQHWTKTPKIKDWGKNQGSSGLNLVLKNWVELWAPTQST